MADECNIKVVCRVRPLNNSEEKAGSKFMLKFPTDDSTSVGVSKPLPNVKGLKLVNAKISFRGDSNYPLA